MPYCDRVPNPYKQQMHCPPAPRVDWLFVWCLVILALCLIGPWIYYEVIR